MPSPIFSKKTSTDSAYSLDERAKALFRMIYLKQNEEDREDETPKIRVSSIISKMSFYYEKIRNTVEYKEEHLYRKNAIERILKREIIIQGAFQKPKSAEVARKILTELIRASYLPNNRIPETKISEVAVIVDKFAVLRDLSIGYLEKYQIDRSEFTRWVLGACASEIEDLIGGNDITKSIAEYMFEVMSKNTALETGSPYTQDKDIQVYLSIHREFLKYDREMLSLILLKYYNKDWSGIDTDSLPAIAQNIGVLLRKIEYELDHPLSKQIDKIARRYMVLFTIFREVVEDDPVSVYNNIKYDPKAFPRQIKRICEKKYKDTIGKLWGAGFRSIIYIFLTKSILAFILEVPISNLLKVEASIFSLVINILFPPFILFLLILFTGKPGDENSKKIVEGIEQIVYLEKERKDPYMIREPLKKKGGLHMAFNFIYALTFFISLGLVSFALVEIGFSYISIIIFIFFLALVSFFSIRIRRNVRELMIAEPRESFFSLLSDFFYTPIISLGKYLSENFSKINVFIFILDFIIEAPFKIFVEIAEEWTKYVRERREEI